MINAMRVGWGQENPAFRQLFSTLLMPDASPLQAQQLNDLARVSATAETAARMERAFYGIDVTNLAPQVKAPTIILHPRQDATIPFEESRLLAALIPEARFVPLESRNHVLLEDEPAWHRFVDEVQRFLGQPIPA
jgi:pimeloyl-ACP methyl ester carboxylesterase